MTTAAVVWQLLGSAQTRDDEANGGAFRHLVEAYTEPLSETEKVVRASDRTGFPSMFLPDSFGTGQPRPGWSDAVDPDTTQTLEWLAQFFGVPVADDWSTQTIRAELRNPTSWKFGTIAALQIAADRWLTTGSAVITEFAVDLDDYTVRVTYNNSQINSLTNGEVAALYPTNADAKEAYRINGDVVVVADQVEASVNAALPADIVADVQRLI